MDTLTPSQRYVERNRDTIRTRQREAARSLRARALEVLGGECAHCGFDKPCALQIDHVNGGGHQERLSFNGQQRAIYLRVVRGEPGYQLLCANCNWIKRCEKGEI